MSQMTAEWPTRGETPWDEKLRAYIDEAFGLVRGDMAVLLPKDPPLDLYLYGASYSVLANAFFTPGHHYAHILRDALGADSVTSYGVNGRRALDVASTLLQGVGFPGVLGIIAAGKWPGTPARRGIIIPDQLGNDVMNQASNNGGVITVQAITGAGGTTYLNYLRQTYRAAFALMSTETRVENHSHTAAVGTWTHESAGPYASGGTTCFTTTPGDYAEYQIAPPQYGPNAGKVWVIVVGDLPSNLQYATMQIAVDGTNQGAAITPSRHSYIAQGGATVKGIIAAFQITLPVDGATHIVRFTHAGTAGHYMILDTLLIGSEEPNPILAMGVERPPVAHASGLSALNVNLYKGNLAQVTSMYKQVVAEFGNAVYVPSNMTTSGLWSGDGLHPNDRGEEQRALDALSALLNSYIRAWLFGRMLADTPDSEFGII